MLEQEADRRSILAAGTRAMVAALKQQTVAGFDADSRAKLLGELVWDSSCEIPLSDEELPLALWDRLVCGVYARLSVLEQLDADDSHLKIEGGPSQADALGITDTWKFAVDFVDSFERHLQEVLGRPALQELWQKLNASRHERLSEEMLIGLTHVQRQISAIGGYEDSRAMPFEAATHAANKDRIWRVPYPRSDHFVVTEQSRAWLDNVPSPTFTPAVRVLTGLGGVGKTEVALEYCYRRGPTGKIVFWIDGGSPSSVVSGLLELAHRLGVSGHDSLASILALNEQLARLDAWLLVIDGAGDPSASTGLGPPLRTVRDLFPRLGSGEVVVTSIDRSWARPPISTDLETWPPDVAVSYLLQRVTDDETSASELAQDLGGLPLSLNQAAAYCHETGIEYGEYRRRLHAVMHQGVGGVGPYCGTIRLALAEVSASQTAKHLIQMSAFMAGEGIPRSMFVTPVNKDAPEVFEDLEILQRMDEALALLFRFSLVKFASGTIVVHRLVQIETLRQMNDTERSGTLSWVFLTLWARGHRHPKVESAWQALNLTVPHIFRAVEFDNFPSDAGLMAVKALHGIIPLLHTAGRQSEMLFATGKSLTLALAQGDFGENQLAGMRATHAGALAASGRYDEAYSVIAPAIAWVESNARDDPDTAGAVLNNRAFLDTLKDDHVNACLWLSRAARLEEESFGSRSMQLAGTMSNLGDSLIRTGQLLEARTALEKAYQIRSQVAGHDAPDTLADALKLCNALRSLDPQRGMSILADCKEKIRKAIHQREPWSGSVARYFAQSAKEYGWRESGEDLLSMWQSAIDNEASVSERCRTMVAIATMRTQTDRDAAMEIAFSAWDQAKSAAAAEADELVQLAGWELVRQLEVAGRQREVRSVLEEMYERLANTDEHRFDLVLIAYLLSDPGEGTPSANDVRWAERAASLISRGVSVPAELATRVFIQLGFAAFERKEMESAILNFVAAYNRMIAEKDFDQSLAGEVVTTLGSALARTGSWELAVDLLQGAVESDRLDQERLGATLGNLGLSYLGLGEYEKAAETLVLAIKTKVSSGNETALAATYYNLAEARHALGAYTSALEAVDVAIDLESRVADRLAPTRLSTLLLRSKILVDASQSSTDELEQIRDLVDQMTQAGTLAADAREKTLQEIALVRQRQAPSP